MSTISVYDRELDKRYGIPRAMWGGEVHGSPIRYWTAVRRICACGDGPNQIWAVYDGNDEHVGYTEGCAACVA